MILNSSTLMEAPSDFLKPHQLPVVHSKKSKKLSMNDIRAEDHYQGQGELYAWMGSAVAQKNTNLPPLENNYGNQPVNVNAYQSFQESEPETKQVTGHVTPELQSTMLQSRVSLKN